MVTLYPSKLLKLLKRSSIHKDVSFFIVHMNYLTQQLLNAEEINLIKKDLEDESQNWEDGENTAGSHDTFVKNNLQLNRNSEVSKKYSQFVNEKILSSQLIKSFSLPKRIHGIMFTKSSKNMHYGRHIDLSLIHI